MTTQQKKLSAGEWDVMEVIWRHQRPITVREVLQILCPKSEKAYTTIQTVMNNLEKKGFLVKEKIGLVNFYRTTVRRKEAVTEATKTFVKRVFSGSFHDLANYLIKSDKLDLDDIAKLKRLISDKEKEVGEG